MGDALGQTKVRTIVLIPGLSSSVIVYHNNNNSSKGDTSD